MILKSGHRDISPRALELYVLLILNHAEDIEKAFNAEHDREQSYEQIIDRLERELGGYKKNREYDYDQIRRQKEQWKKWEDYTSPPEMKDYTYLEGLLKDLE